MNNTYTKPVVAVETGLAEGVYAASGTGTLSVTVNTEQADYSLGTVPATVAWSGINGTITLTIHFSADIKNVTTTNGGTTTTITTSGSTVTLTIQPTAQNPLNLSITAVAATSLFGLTCSYSYTVS